MDLLRSLKGGARELVRRSAIVTQITGHKISGSSRRWLPDCSPSLTTLMPNLDFQSFTRTFSEYQFLAREADPVSPDRRNALAGGNFR
jgi:hypothetical protein